MPMSPVQDSKGMIHRYIYEMIIFKHFIIYFNILPNEHHKLQQDYMKYIDKHD